MQRSVRTGKAGAVDVCQCPGVVNVRRGSGAIYLLLCTWGIGEIVVARETRPA